MFEVTDNTGGIFFNQMGGKTHTFKVFVKRKDTAVVSSSSPVRCTLVYADNLKPAPDTIFRVNGMNDFDEKSNIATFSCRINDVSRNHQGKRFRVKIQDGRGEAFYTAPILVKSKKIKKKTKNKKRKMSHSPSHSPFTHSPFNEPVMKKTCMSTEWQNEAYRVLKSMAWQIIGYEKNPLSSQNVDCSLPIVQCPCCKAIAMCGSSRRHKPFCSLKWLVQEATCPETLTESSYSSCSSDNDSIESVNTKRILAPDTPEDDVEDLTPLSTPFRSFSDQLLADDDELVNLLGLEMP